MGLWSSTRRLVSLLDVQSHNWYKEMSRIQDSFMNMIEYCLNISNNKIIVNVKTLCDVSTNGGAITSMKQQNPVDILTGGRMFFLK